MKIWDSVYIYQNSRIFDYLSLFIDKSLTNRSHPEEPENQNQDWDDKQLSLNPGPIQVDEREIFPVENSHFEV